MGMDSSLEENRSDILRIAANHGARDVRVFGSRARGQAHRDSDLDLLITLEKGKSLLDIVAIKQDIEDLLGYKVDVVTEAAISPYMRDRILEEAVPL
jgi:predicted nucleotidyltransferase